MSSFTFRRWDCVKIIKDCNSKCLWSFVCRFQDVDLNKNSKFYFTADNCKSMCVHYLVKKEESLQMWKVLDVYCPLAYGIENRKGMKDWFLLYFLRLEWFSLLFLTWIWDYSSLSYFFFCSGSKIQKYMNKLLRMKETPLNFVVWSD